MGTNRNPSHTKSGPGRKHDRTRNADKKIGQLFLKGLIASWASKRRNDKARHLGPRDKNGAFTLVGQPSTGTRRMWLAGVSAQRGY